MNEKQLKEIEDRANAAFEDARDYEVLGQICNLADAEFINHARTDVPALVAEVRRLQKQVDELKVDLKVADANLSYALRKLRAFTQNGEVK